MYKVFVNNQSIHFIKKLNVYLFDKEDIEIYFYHSKKDLKSFINEFVSQSLTKELYIYCPEGVYNVFMLFKTFYKEIKAGGGLVKNKKNQYLFIFRKGKWDLPKGKVEKDESIKTCAIREVKEETGLKNVKIIKKLPDTYHLYTEKGKTYLKHCYWYLMETEDTLQLYPQLEEGITLTEWMNENSFTLIFENTFLSIRNLMENYLKKLN